MVGVPSVVPHLSSERIEVHGGWLSFSGCWRSDQRGVRVSASCVYCVAEKEKQGSARGRTSGASKIPTHKLTHRKGILATPPAETTDVPCHGRRGGFESHRPRYSFQALAAKAISWRGKPAEVEANLGGQQSMCWLVPLWFQKEGEKNERHLCLLVAESTDTHGRAPEKAALYHWVVRADSSLGIRDTRTIQVPRLPMGFHRFLTGHCRATAAL